MFATLRSCFCRIPGEASVAPFKQHSDESAADAKTMEIEPRSMRDKSNEESKEQISSPDMHQSDEMWEPSADDQELIRRTWSDDFECLYDIGLLIYTHLFEDHPITKNFFPSIHQHGGSWKQSQEFRHQALSFAKTVSYAVEHITSHEALASYLSRVGARHVEYGNRFDTRFEQAHWDLIQGALDAALKTHVMSLRELSSEEQSQAVHLWSQLVRLIIVYMKNGYDEMLQRESNKS